MPPVGARQPLHAADRAARGELGRQPVEVGLERGLAADCADEVVHQQRLVRLPAPAVPHQPLAPGGAAAPVFAVAGCEGQRQRVVGGPDGKLLRGLPKCWLDAHPWARGDEGGDVEAFGDRVGRIPPRACRRAATARHRRWLRRPTRPARRPSRSPSRACRDRARSAQTCPPAATSRFSPPGHSRRASRWWHTPLRRSAPARTSRPRPTRRPQPWRCRAGCRAASARVEPSCAAWHPRAGTPSSALVGRSDRRRR